MRRFLSLALVLLAPAMAQTSASAHAEQSPSAAQPNLPPGAPVRPEPVPYAPPKPGSPVVQELVGGKPLVVRKHVARKHVARKHVAREHVAREHVAREHVAREHISPHRLARHRPVPFDLERPALAGVTLLQPLPPAPQPPHVVVPVPAYPLDALAASFLTPAPAIVCRRTPRIRDLPDPRLYKEATLDCEPDNP